MVLRPAAWSEIGASDVVIEWVTDGVPIPFSSEPEPKVFSNPRFTDTEVDFLNNELINLESRGVVQRVSETPHCVSPLKVVPKPSGKFRLICDLRSSWEARLLWSPGAREDLSWWVSSLDGWNGRLLVPPAVCELQLSTDASGSGWGAVLSTPSCQLASGFWDQLLDRMFGPHTVDRFAAVGTALLPTYNSRFADPCSSGVDALGQTDWGAENNWVNPPFRLIPRVLDIIEAQRADATLIAPMWPGQPWMARLRRLCTAPPIRLPPVTRSCLPLSEQQRIEPHQNRRWTLCAWRISGAHG
ncbi:uncharacterized protein LOC122392575 isoform X6 [Amphibalanus amphitrite]|uniref:uncharacterized protein LOC122392575 isoform X6 n=1 Tax=Amphibalanus amphitrite TaxID=1232801 RepID=UPI001C8FE007|nr:uncharacterized protein LOC122392575 isoform X6 [Amphibalanus amphitrite]